MRLWFLSCTVRGFFTGHKPAMTFGATFTPCIVLKPIIVPMLLDHMSQLLFLFGLSSSSCAFSIHSGAAKIVPSATVDSINSPALVPIFPAVLDVALTTLSATLPKIGETTPVALPIIAP